MTSLTQPLATSMADERQRAGDEMHDDGTVTSTMTADAIEYTISGEIHSGVGVLDKTVKILDALESGPATLGQLVSATGLARPTAHRLAIALERHRFVLRDQHGRFVLGSRFAELAAAAANPRKSTAVRAISACASPRWNAPAACAIRFPWARCCRWRPGRPRRFCSPGRIPSGCIRG